jgi:hypothetical protein
MLAKEKYGIRGREITNAHAEFVPFTAQTRMSGVNMNGDMIRKGAADSVRKFVAAGGGGLPAEIDQAVEKISRAGGTPLVVATKKRRWASSISRTSSRRPARSLPALPRHGHQDRHDHRRQSADRRRHRQGSRRR